MSVFIICCFIILTIGLVQKDAEYFMWRDAQTTKEESEKKESKKKESDTSEAASGLGSPKETLELVYDPNVDAWVNPEWVEACKAQEEKAKEEKKWKERAALLEEEAIRSKGRKDLDSPDPLKKEVPELPEEEILLPKFIGSTKEDLVKYLEHKGWEGDVSGMSKLQLWKECKKIG